MAELVDAALHGGTESYVSAAFKIRTGSNPVLTTKGRQCEGPECTQNIHIDSLERQHI